jgi:type VI protein secretion system component Hcp
LTWDRQKEKPRRRLLHSYREAKMTAKNPSKNPSPAPSVIKTDNEITDAELDKATGGTEAGSGKVAVHDLNITKHVDVSSPKLLS